MITFLKVLGLCLSCAVIFGAGFFLGLGGGAANYQIDLCDDKTSGKYITHEETRKMVCE